MTINKGFKFYLLLLLLVVVVVVVAVVVVQRSICSIKTSRCLNKRSTWGARA